MAASKVFVPLESNPDLFTQLIHDIGVMPCLEFRDVYSIDEPSLLALLPRPVLALILVGPSRAGDAKPREPEPTEAAGEDIVWFKQTIQNACGLYAILHSVSNGPARDYIRTYCGAYFVCPLLSADVRIPGKDSVLDSLIRSCQRCSADKRAQMVEDCAALERAYESAARAYEQSSVPADPQQLDNHYLCFVKSRKSGNLYRVSGSGNGAVDQGPLPADEDVLGARGIAIIKNILDAAEGRANAAFSLIALVPHDHEES